MKSAELEATLKASESKSSDAQQQVQELKHTRDTVDYLESKVNEVEKSSCAFQEQI